MIQIGTKTVTKTAPPEKMRVEVEKTRRASKIALDCGLFRVPKVLDFDHANGVAVFERLDVAPVSGSVKWGEPRRKLAKCLGTSLAVIHRELKLPPDMTVPLPPELAFPCQEVFLHGDVSVGNVCVGTSWPPIAIFDWQMTPLYGGEATYGTRYFDILWFINNLINRPFLRFLFENPVQPVIEAFLQAYFDEARCPYEAEKFIPYAERFFEMEMLRIKNAAARGNMGRSRFLLPCSRRILKDLMKSLGTDEYCECLSFSENRDEEHFERKDYRRSHIHPDKGKSYHLTFSENPYRRMVWQFEKNILDRILSTFFKGEPIRHLDFACGTGRILSYLEDRVSSSTGVDVSPSMLEIARQNNRSAEILKADLTEIDVLGKRKFNLITAFRFFPNAEEELRTEAIKILISHLDDNGLLVFNNHKNAGSARYRLARLLGRGGGQGMTNDEVRELVARNELEILKIFPLCILPASEKRKLLPFFLLRPFEVFFSKFRVFKNLGENVIFVCLKSEKKSSDEKTKL
jgi:SAM-dependent methyltransferase